MGEGICRHCRDTEALLILATLVWGGMSHQSEALLMSQVSNSPRLLSDLVDGDNHREWTHSWIRRMQPPFREPHQSGATQ